MKNTQIKAIELILSCKNVPSEELESETVEFKCYKNHKSLCDAKELAEEIVAFANTKGGIVVIGIKDSSNVVHGEWHTQLEGIEGVDVTEFGERIRGRIKPNIDLSIAYFLVDGRRYLSIGIPSIRDSIVSTVSGKVYRRDGRSSVPMDPDEIIKLVKGLQNYDWSDQSADLAVTDLHHDSVEEARIDYAKRRGLDPEGLGKVAFLEAIGATKNGHLNKAGLLMFGDYKSIQAELGLYEYRFSWKTRGGALMVNDVWNGNLWATIKRSKTHFESCNSKITFKFKNKDYLAPLFDEIAFHEAFMNSLVHRDYNAEGMVAVDYDSNRMRITNPGGFYGGVTPDNITHHQPRHRNKCLANMLMAFQLVDRAGMGIKRMGRQSLMYGRRFPIFSEKNGSVMVTMYGEALRPGIFVVGQNDQFGLTLPQFYILNILYKVGYKSIDSIERELSSVFDLDWDEFMESIESMDQVQICGTKAGIYVRIEARWNETFEVSKNLRTHGASSSYVKLYKLAKKCGDISNEDVRNLLNHKSCSQTSQFLRKCEFFTNSGAGTSSRWSYSSTPD